MHTQTIESFNGTLKDKIRKRSGVVLTEMIPFLEEFNFRHKFLRAGNLNSAGEFVRSDQLKKEHYGIFLDILAEVYPAV